MQGVVSALKLHGWTLRSLLTYWCHPVYCRAATEKKDSVTVTGEEAHWVLPSNQEVSYKEVSDIDFSCPNTSETNVPGPEKKKEVPSSTPTEIELQDFFGKLSLCKSKQAILSLVRPYNQSQSKKFTLKL